MKTATGVLKTVGSWNGQRGSDGGRMEFVDIGDEHIRRIGCTSYLHDILTTNVGGNCELYFTSILGGKLGHELLAVRLPDGQLRVAGKARVMKLFLAMLILLPILSLIVIGCPLGILVSVLSKVPLLGNLSAFLAVLIGIAIIGYCVYLAFMVLADYNRLNTTPR